MPVMNTTGLPHTDYYLIIRRDRNSEWQREWEKNTSKLHYIKPRIEEWESAYNSSIAYKQNYAIAETSFWVYHVLILYLDLGYIENK